MNIMLRVLSAALVMFIAFSNFTIVDAKDNFDWDDIKAKYQYDSGDDELEITVYLDDITSRPDEDYEIELEVDNKDYDKDMTYSSSRDELYARFDFDNVDSDELEDYLDLEVIVKDEDNDRVFTGDIEMSSSTDNDDNFDWNEVEVTYDYNSSRDRLNIKIELNNVDNKPDYTYTANVEVDGEDYDEKMFYSSSSDRLYANFYISNVDSDELNDFDDMQLKIEDDEENTVYDEDLDMESGSTGSSSNNSSDSKIDWSNLKTTVVYEKDKNRLNIRTQLNNVEKKGNGEDYDVTFVINSKNYKVNMFYSETNKTLYSYKLLNVFSASRVDSKYDVKVIIEDEDNDEIYNKTSRITTNKNGSSTSSGTNTNETTTSSSNSNASVFAYRYIFKAEAKYSTTLQRKAALKRMVTALKQARYSYSNKAYIDGIIETIEDRINSYDSSSNSGNTSNNSIKKVNKAERIIHDDSGSFKYYGGYNY